MSVIEAIEMHDKHKLKTLITSTDVNQRDGYGRTPLFIAMLTMAKHSFISLLLDNQADPNVVDEYRQTPLHCIYNDDQLPTIQLLVEHKANPFIKDIRGYTPIQVAILNKCYKIVKYLLKQTYVVADISISVIADNTNATLLHNAVLTNDLYMVQILLPYMTADNVDYDDNNGYTPLDYAQRLNNVAIINALRTHKFK